ncbi:unnamed protein product [Spirodela intermedia]|uniref:Uncharacterized protein n=2 Tax=Spirodela intermedia TaxID=51605 RepID=A0A7I8ITT8_SPIIN|nr:unnamed protein product [Spirodela intermedia]CAA6660979.1 unnamed protein product [Spirodela intermedia]CAA7397340.1 unnamed protein product [Spirodela intermedia]
MKYGREIRPPSGGVGRWRWRTSRLAPGGGAWSGPSRGCGPPGEARRRKTRRT